MSKAIVLILLLTEFSPSLSHGRQDIVSGGFDGFYTYFAANGFSYGSSWKNWKSLSSFARKNGLLFAPSVGPGYIDTRVRPWNVKTTRERKNGKYYKIAWATALQTNPPLISITSFNEWHEGTQVSTFLLCIHFFLFFSHYSILSVFLDRTGYFKIE